MKITEYWQNFTSREKLLIFVGLGVALIAAIGGMFGMWDSHVAVAPVPPSQSSGGFTPSQPTMPQGYQASLAGNGQPRDPFAIPDGYQEKEGAVAPNGFTKPSANGEGRFSSSAASTAGRGTGYSSVSKQHQAAAPVLTGVGGTENRRVALIQYGGKTQPYEVGEMVGSGFQLLAVYNDSATLWGPNGKLVLTLGR